MGTQSDAATIQAAIADPVPKIAPTPDTTVELFRGVKDAKTGEWETTAVVRELTGEDEEALAAMDSDGDLLYAQYMATLLKRSVVSIGNVKITEKPEVIDTLIIGDRDTLFLATVRATYGETREYQMDCPHCKKSNDVLIEMNEFPVKKPKTDPQASIVVELRNGTKQKFRLVTGGDSQMVSKKATSIPEQNTILISRCAEWEEGQKPANLEKWARGLGMKDRAKIISKLLEAQPGPEIREVEAHCAHCKKPFPIMLNWASLLFG
jgi:thiol-disulfide isomerase/thioredoxin